MQNILVGFLHYGHISLSMCILPGGLMTYVTYHKLQFGILGCPED